MEANLNEQSVAKDEGIVTIKWITIILGQRSSSGAISKLIGVEGRYWLTVWYVIRKWDPRAKYLKVL